MALAGELSGLNDNGRQAFVSGLIMVLLALIAVGLRFSTKLHTKLPFSLDDYLLIGGTAAFCAWFGVQVWGNVMGGGGKHPHDPGFNYDLFCIFLKALYFLELIYGLSVTLVKLSILVFLHRVFYDNQRNVLVYSLYAVCIIWWIVYTITACVQCQPVERFWNPREPGTCFNYGLFFLGTEVADIIINFSILLAPLTLLYKMQLPAQKKIATMALFCFGGFVCITGIARVALTYLPGRRYISFSQAELWTNIHVGTAILCACLPLSAPIFAGILTVIRNSAHGIQSTIRRGETSNRHCMAERAWSPTTSETELKLHGGMGCSHTAVIRAFDRSEIAMHNFSPLALSDGIRVQTTISIS